MKDYRRKALLVWTSSMILGLAAFAGGEGKRGSGKDPGLGNELIDVETFRSSAMEALLHRANRRITETRFLEMAADKDTIVLDTRSAAKFALLHVKGAKNLNFSEITTESLARTIPGKETRILIYCNNNFDKEPAAFPSKKPDMALNIPTFITLYSYGYKNVYELGPLLDIRKTRIPLEGVKFARND